MRFVKQYFRSKSVYSETLPRQSLGTIIGKLHPRTTSKTNVSRFHKKSLGTDLGNFIASRPRFSMEMAFPKFSGPNFTINNMAGTGAKFGTRNFEQVGAPS